MRRAAVALVAISLGAWIVPAASARRAADAASPAAGATVSGATALGHAGRWVTDGSGRVVIVHGVNVPTKTLPAYPGALHFDDDDAALLARLGFNAVRLTVERYAVEPTPGQFDAAYVNHFAETIRTLAAHGVLSVIDFHQDEYGPTFFDNGFPDWMTITDGLPNLFFVGFPTQYFANPALNRAFDHLWANDIGPSGRPLQSDDGAILAYVASALHSQPGILGYEIINEPWPGSAYPTCVTPTTGCPDFDTGALSQYYARIVPAIRAADPTHMIWYEPLTTFNQGVPTHVVPPADPGVGFAFHDYGLCGATDDAGAPASVGQTCSAEDAMVMNNAVAHSTATGSALLETEFGATMTPDTIDRQVTMYDANMIPWMFWSYTRYIDRLAPDGTLLPATDDNVNWPIVNTLVRPYPTLVSGTPTAWNFDSSTDMFTLAYSTLRADGSGRFHPGTTTQVFVPTSKYPTGYHVAVSGGTVVSSANATTLQIASCPRAQQVHVTVTEGTGTQSSC